MVQRKCTQCKYHGLHEEVNSSGRVTAKPAGLKVDLRVTRIYRNGLSSVCILHNTRNNLSSVFYTQVHIP
jgi:hypothetical protein